MRDGGENFARKGGRRVRERWVAARGVREGGGVWVSARVMWDKVCAEAHFKIPESANWVK